MNKKEAYRIFKKEEDRNKILDLLKHDINLKRDNLLNTFIEVYGKEYEDILKEKFEEIEFQEYFSVFDLKENYLDRSCFKNPDFKLVGDDANQEEDDDDDFGKLLKETFPDFKYEDKREYNELIYNYLNYLLDFKDEIEEFEYITKHQFIYFDEMENLSEELFSSLKINLKSLEKYKLLFNFNDELEKKMKSYSPIFLDRNFDLNTNRCINIIWIKCISQIYLEGIAINLISELVDIINSSLIEKGDNYLKYKVGINSFENRSNNIKKFEKKYDNVEDINFDFDNGYGKVFYTNGKNIETVYDILKDDFNFIITREIFNTYKKLYGSLICEDEYICSIGVKGELLKLEEFYKSVKSSYIKSIMYNDDNIFINSITKENYDKLINMFKKGFEKTNGDKGYCLRIGFVQKDILESDNDNLKKDIEGETLYIDIFEEYEKEMNELINNIINL